MKKTNGNKAHVAAKMPLNAQGRIVDEFLLKVLTDAESAYDAMRSVPKAERLEFWDNNVKYWGNVISGLRWARGVLKQSTQYKAKRRATNERSSA